MVIGIHLLFESCYTITMQLYTVMYIFYTCGYIASPKEVDFGQFEAMSCATINTMAC